MVGIWKNLLGFVIRIGLVNQTDTQFKVMHAMDLAKDPKFPLHTKHIDIRYHFICEVIEDEKLELKYVPGEENLTDILMKLLTPETFENMTEQLGLR
jgi:hypothetical protein